ncbi:hypothetical protein ACFX11_014369 [Malus domestica]
MVDSSFAMGARRQWMDFATHVTNVSTPFSPTIFTNHVLSYPVRSATGPTQTPPQIPMLQRSFHSLHLRFLPPALPVSLHLFRLRSQGHQMCL